MSIKLIKISKDLNVGISTAAEFLQKKGFTVEANPNTKINEEQYALLLREFSKDKNLKIESEKFSQERQKDHKKKETVAIEGYETKNAGKKVSEEIKMEVPVDFRPQFKTIGKIDLDALNRPKAPKTVVEPKMPEKIVEEQQDVPEEVVDIQPIETETEIRTEEINPEITEEVLDETVAEEVETAPGDSEENEIEGEDREEEESEEGEEESEEEEEDDDEQEEEDVIEDDDAVEEDDTAEEDPAIEEDIENKDTTVSDEEQSTDVFRLNKATLESNIKVKGKIDLSTLNQTTRPKKKTKEEKRKEREDKKNKSVELKKIAKENVKKENVKAEKLTLTKKENLEEADKKKKRNRIKKEKIDIEKGGQNFPKRDDNRLKLRKPVKAEVNEEDVQRQIKETLARLTVKGKGSKGAKYRKDKRDAVSQRQQEQMELDAMESKLLKITEFVTASDLANMMNLPVVQIISTCMSIGIMVSINQRLDAETINIVAEEFGFKTEYVSAEVVEAIAVEEDREEDLVARPPIVTVMGHVDHGKTSLLDNIRNTNVIAGESGGITQHIGAYNVTLEDGRKITFLDTPGHEAFTAMRARGASMTDIAVIIVAADDDVMPQTIEAINHASAANVPIVFAINKVDKQGANPEKIKETLAAMNYLVEDWGGKYQSHDISAKKGIGIHELLEKILLEAEILDLKANPNKRATGSIIESTLDKGRGHVATVLVQGGTLKNGDTVLAGTHFGRIKAMFNERNQRVSSAGPSEPVLILGLNGAPQAGDTFYVLETEQEAREIAGKREQLQREQGLRTQKHLTLDDIGRRIAIGNFQELNVIVKGDVDGSVEALSDSLIRLSTDEIQVNVIHKAVGQISESDVTLAAASNAIIVGFQVRPSSSARKLADKEGVDVRLYSIIYDAIEEVKSAMEGMLSPEYREEITATVEVQEVFKITKVGTVAGCLVKEGKIKRGNRVRLIRDGIVVHSGELDSLKRFKDDVKEVTSGYECGLNITNYNDVKIGDIIESYEQIEIKKTL
ncbi:MAG: translation initiation factor IF-2 [Dysgonamonadaceae bacterium]|jgi:translation initiation factor IF-2|nr:translation initiation factor IF-2 [Dysgonamonadaceae bacterium]